MKTPYKLLLLASAIFIGFVGYNTYDRSTSPQFVPDKSVIENPNYQRIIFAGGCFWCTESEFNHKEGVISAVSGYTESEKQNPTYNQVSSGEIKAREAVEVLYDPKIITIDSLFETYFRHIDPTDGEGQFADRGYHYSPAIYYTNETQQTKALELITKIDVLKKFKKPVRVQVLAFQNFYPAEEYHQDYKDKNPVRYSVYREGSGRNIFVREYWSDESPFVKELFGVKNTPPQVMSEKTSKVTPLVNSWENFSQAMKAEALKQLTPLQYKVTQEDATEKPFTNDIYTENDKGIYVDVVSGEPLFLSIDKYDSGTGWPSFVKPLNVQAVTLHEDDGLFSNRTEVRSKIADSHLGHVFDDGPSDRGGKRYCMNGAALKFVPINQMEQQGYGEYKKLIP